MKRVIIESPFAATEPHTVEENLAYLRAAMHDCLLKGEAPFASHAIYTQPGVLDDNIPDERKLGIEAGFAWCGAAEMTVVYTDHGVTPGMEQGVENAKDLGLLIEYRTIPDWEC